MVSTVRVPIPASFHHGCAECRIITDFTYTPSDHEVEKGYRFECRFCGKRSVLMLFEKVIYCFRCSRATMHRFQGYDAEHADYSYWCGKCGRTFAKVEPFTDEKE